MSDIVVRLRFDAVRCEMQFSKGVAGNIEEAAAEIERLRAALRRIVATPRDDWQFRDGSVVGEVHLIAMAALEQKA